MALPMASALCPSVTRFSWCLNSNLHIDYVQKLPSVPLKGRVQDKKLNLNTQQDDENNIVINNALQS